MDFNQTQAALILEKNLPLLNEKCASKYDVISFVQNLCTATYVEYSIKDNLKDFVNFSYTSAGYFLINNFDTLLEHEIASGLYLGIVKHNRLELCEYFGTDIKNILNTTKQPAFKTSNDYFIVPDISQSIIVDFVEILKRFKQKGRVINQNPIREILVYYSIYLFKDYYNNNNGVLHLSAAKILLQQVEYAATKVFHYGYNSISPEQEVMQFIENKMILSLEEKYFKYIFS